MTDRKYNEAICFILRLALWSLTGMAIGSILSDVVHPLLESLASCYWLYAHNTTDPVSALFGYYQYVSYEAASHLTMILAFLTMISLPVGYTVTYRRRDA